MAVSKRKEIHLSDYPREKQKELLEHAQQVIPDGGPLDDDWPDCHDDVSEVFDKNFPEFESLDTFALCNDLIDAAIRGLDNYNKYIT